MRSLLPAFLIPALLFLAGCDLEDLAQQDRFTAESHYSLKPSSRLEVETRNGDIEIVAGDQPTIEITAQKRAATQSALDAIRILTEESPDVNFVRTSEPDRWEHNHSSVRYIIRAPRQTSLSRIVSSNGSVRISGMASGARIETSNGSIDLSQITGAVTARSSNGSLDLESITGDVEMQTTNGKIRGEDLTGRCDARTTNGSATLRFRQTPEGPVRVETTNGAVEIELPASPKAGLRAETVNGSLRLNLPSDTTARLIAESSVSSISSDFEINGTHDRHRLEGAIGGGGPLIELTTRNGQITVRRVL